MEEKELMNMIWQITQAYNKKEQVIQTVEEMAELTKELLKNINRGKDNRADIVSEMADVYIMLEQMMIYYDINLLELVKEMKRKAERQIKRIKEK